MVRIKHVVADFQPIKIRDRSEFGLASPRAYEPTSATPAMVGWWVAQAVTRSKKSETTCAVLMEESRIAMPKAVYKRHHDYPCPQGSRFRR